MKTHQYQRSENNLTESQMRDDNDIINLVCDLYDLGVTGKVIRQIFKDIERVRARDLADDISNLETHMHNSIR